MILSRNKSKTKDQEADSDTSGKTTLDGRTAA